MIPSGGWIKVCGVTTVHDAEMLVDAGADAIGLNLWHGSPRSVDMARALEIAEAIRGRLQVVSVTVDMDLHGLRQVQAHLRPDWMQLHGDEPDEVLPALGGRAFRAVGLATQADVERAKAVPGPWVLVDARDEVRRGGTGTAAPEGLVAAVRAARPVVLAGGLTPDNVAAAIRALRPVGVDVASGVEYAPGAKDRERVRAFVASARAAFAAAPAQQR